MFPNGKLDSLIMVFDSTFHQKIREMLIWKYGKTYEYTYTINTLVKHYHNTSLPLAISGRISGADRGVYAS